MLRFTTERGSYTARTLIVASQCPHYTPFPVLVLSRPCRQKLAGTTFCPRMLFLTMPCCRTNRQHRLGLLRPCIRFSPFGSRKHDGSISGPRRFSDSARRHCFCLSRSKSKPCLMLIHLYFYMSLILTQQKTVLRKDNPIPFRLPEIFHIYVKNS